MAFSIASPHEQQSALGFGRHPAFGQIVNVNGDPEVALEDVRVW